MEFNEYTHTYPFSSQRAAHHANYWSKFKLKYKPVADTVKPHLQEPAKLKHSSGQLISKSSEKNTPIEPPKLFKNKLLAHYNNLRKY